jgi:hypothetical protein
LGTTPARHAERAANTPWDRRSSPVPSAKTRSRPDRHGAVVVPLASATGARYLHIDDEDGIDQVFGIVPWQP